MALVLKCACGKLLDIDEQHRGERGQCPWCGNQFTVGEVINSTTAVQTDAAANKGALAASGREKLNHSDNVPADPQIARPKSIPWLVWLLGFACLLGLLCGWPAYHVYSVLHARAENAKKDTAKATLQGPLSQACEAYCAHRGVFPENLDQLLRRDEIGGPYVKSPDIIVDPWGRPYRYDKAGMRNKEFRPDIWTIAPDGTEFGNWPKGR